MLVDSLYPVPVYLQCSHLSLGMIPWRIRFPVVLHMTMRAGRVIGYFKREQIIACRKCELSAAWCSVLVLVACCTRTVQVICTINLYLQDQDSSLSLGRDEYREGE